MLAKVTCRPEWSYTDGRGGSNELLDAIRAIAHEGTRAEVAGNFREHGNECAREKKWTDAREYYSKAIVALHSDDYEGNKVGGGDGGEDGDDEVGAPEIDLTKDRVVDVVEEERKERAIEEACYVNRALCNLELSTYWSPCTTVGDAMKTLLYFVFDLDRN